LNVALPVRTQTWIIDGIAEQTGFSKSDVRVFFQALDAEILDSLKNCERARFCGLTVEPVLKAATKKRMGRNPKTGEEVVISPKPASTNVKVRVAKPLREAAPSVQKLRRAVANGRS